MKEITNYLLLGNLFVNKISTHQVYLRTKLNFDLFHFLIHNQINLYNSILKQSCPDRRTNPFYSLFN